VYTSPRTMGLTIVCKIFPRLSHSQATGVRIRGNISAATSKTAAQASAQILTGWPLIRGQRPTAPMAVARSSPTDRLEGCAATGGSAAGSIGECGIGLRSGETQERRNLFYHVPPFREKEAFIIRQQPGLAAGLLPVCFGAGRNHGPIRSQYSGRRRSHWRSSCAACR